MARKINTMSTTVDDLVDRPLIAKADEWLAWLATKPEQLGAEYLFRLSKDNSVVFMLLLGKLLPTQRTTVRRL
jgi:hypothetical protein